MSDSFLRPKDAAEKAGISKSHLYRLVSQERFPHPIKISERISAFLESEVDEWIAERVAAVRNGGEV